MFQSSRLEQAWRVMEFARDYTRSLLVDIEADDWFRQPPGGVTHLAWQVGHLAMAEYGLLLFRQRGRQPVDTEIMSGKFRKAFSKGSTPDADPDNNPPIAEILGVFQRVHEQAAEELPRFTDAQLDEPVDMPYAGDATKFGSILFCSHHEMLHAGQIGLLRRLLGKAPVR